MIFGWLISVTVSDIRILFFKDNLSYVSVHNGET